jgi:hypothetical protein
MVGIKLITQQEVEHIFNAVDQALGRDAEPYFPDHWQNLIEYSLDNYPGPTYNMIR